MKVMHVETGRHFYGGAQQALYLSRGLQDRDVDSTIVCPPDAAIGDLARQAGLPVRRLRCGGDLDLSFAFRLRRLLLRESPDIVHCHGRRGADLLGGWAARLAGVPAVLSRRVDSVDFRWLARGRYAPYRAVIAISDTVRDALVESGLGGGKIVGIRSAVDAGAMRPAMGRDRWRAEFNIADGDVVAAVAAQLIERKGHRFLFRAMPELCRAHPEFRVLIFGRGPLEATLRDEVARLGLSDHVHFVGFREDLDQLLGHADLLIHPALKEGLGVAMLKAAAAALPVVAFDVAGAREAVVHEETGFLVPPADSARLLQALMNLVENPATRQTLGKAGQSRMQREFSTDVMVGKHVLLYESIVGDK